MTIYTGLASKRGNTKHDFISIDINYLNLTILENRIYFLFICIHEDGIEFRKVPLFPHLNSISNMNPKKGEKIL